MCEMIDFDNERNGLLIQFNSILYFTLYMIFTQVYRGREIK